jgi:hypothetical protein
VERDNAAVPNEEIIDALKEADEIARDPSREHFTTLEALFADLKSYDEGVDIKTVERDGVAAIQQPTGVNIETPSVAAETTPAAGDVTPTE